MTDHRNFAVGLCEGILGLVAHIMDVPVAEVDVWERGSIISSGSHKFDIARRAKISIPCCTGKKPIMTTRSLR